MEFTDAIEWLDMQIYAKKILNGARCFNSQIAAVGTDEDIHIYRGIEILAGVLGAEMTENVQEGSKYKYRFRYKGIEVFQMSKERIPLNAEQ